MRLRFLLVLICLVFASGLFSQKKQTLSHIYTTSTIKVNNPYMVDSINLKGEKFSEKDLLKMNLVIPEQSAFNKALKADTAGYFHPERPLEGSAFLLYSFYITPSRYAKSVMKLNSSNMMELYVDGKLATSKTTKEGNAKNEKEITATIDPSYPLSNRVVIKILASAEDKNPLSFRVSIENEKGDSLTDFTVSNSEKRFINMADMQLGKRVTNTSISPSGQYILISYRNTFGEKNVSTTELYDTKTGKRIIVNKDGAKKQLSWMPRSEKLFYLLKEDNKTHLVTIDPATLEESVLAKNIPDENIMFTQDEKTFFYTKQEKDDEKKSDLKLLQSPEDRQPGYTNRSFIYRYEIRTGLSQQLTYGAHSTWLNDISFDGKQLLFSVSDETLTERPFKKHSMFKLTLPDMVVDTLWTNEGFAYRASFSPDAKKILIQGSGEAFDGIGLNLDEGQIANSYNRLAYIMNLATKKIEPITKNFDPSIDNAFWNTKDNLIYFRTTDKDCVNMYSYNPSNKKFTKLPLNEDVIRGFSTADNAQFAVYHGVSRSNSARAYIYDIATSKSTLIADPYKDKLSEITLGKVGDWNFTNSAGTDITGSYYLPPNFDASKKYPMIVYYYGGTTPTSRTFESSYPGHVFASQGYVVYVLQPSGTTGFGQKFAALHVNAWGKRTAEDIIEGTQQFIKEHPFVDGKKIGCIGASYGGFMTMYLQTQTDMFAAAVSHAGISSISSYWGEGYWGYTYSSGASAHSYPWNNTDMYVKQSPLFSADKVKTPILFTHGTVDTNVPIGESIQMYTALKILGSPAEFIQVKDENHGIANYKKRIEWNNSIMAWFDKWLKEDDSWWKGIYPNSK